MVFADGVRGLVQIVAADLGDAVMNLMDAGFRLLPVVPEVNLAAPGPLVAAQSRGTGAIGQEKTPTENGWGFIIGGGGGN